MATRTPAPRFFLSDEDPPSKQGVLRAALKLFVTHGISGTNVRMIAAESGYTNPAMFKFFASKDDLALCLFERCYGRLHRRIERAAARSPFRAALAAVLEAFLEAMDEDLEAAVFVQDGLRELWPKLPPSARRRSILRVLRGVVERGIREGAVTGYASPDVPVAALIGLVAQTGRMLHFREIEGPARARRAELQLALTRMLEG